MKVVFFLPNIHNKGGVERATSSLLNALAEDKEYDLYLLCFSSIQNNNGFDINSNIKKHTLNIDNYKRQYVKAIKGIRNFIINNNVDVIISVETMTLLFSYPALVRLENQPKLIVWEHFNFYNNNSRFLRNYLRRLAAKKADAVVTLTKRDFNTWKEHLTINGKIEYIYNISPFIDQQGTYKEDSKTIIAVGRLVDVKGYDRLLRIWSKIACEDNTKGWKLEIIGNGPLKDKLQGYINDHSLSSTVSLLGHTDDLEKHYKNASFLCMASYFEGLPMVLIEAQSFGLPTIAFDCYTGPSEIITNDSGIVIENGDEDLYAEAILRVIKNKELRKSMSLKSKKLSERFECDSITDKWKKLFQFLKEN